MKHGGGDGALDPAAVTISGVRFQDATVAEQLEVFEQFIRGNPVVSVILDRMAVVGLPDCWMAAGALFQTVWNALCERDPTAGIQDYDLNYFDGMDLSWEAENRAIARVARVFDDVDAVIQVRNEARVHLWYEAKFGVVCPPYRSTRHAISTFPSTSSCIGVRQTDDGLEVFAPFGFADLFAMRTRPNPVLAPAAVYQAKTSRWVQEWPQLTILDWPTDANHAAERERFLGTRRGRGAP